MELSDLIPGRKYVVLDTVMVCYYEGHDCLMPNSPNLLEGTILTYEGPDDDQDGGHIFTNEDGTKFCFHENEDDLLYINYATE